MARSFALALLIGLAAPAAAQDACRLCYGDPAAKPGERPLALEIYADLNFAKLALLGRGGGDAQIDAATGAKRTAGELVSLGGMTVTGRGRITGGAGRRVRIELPHAVAMSAPDGGTADLTEFTTDLPRDPVLDANGELTFSFGARLVLRGTTGGNYRGRIPITVDYD